MRNPFIERTAVESATSLSEGNLSSNALLVILIVGAGGPELDLFVLDEDRDTIACELLPDWFSGEDWSTNSGPP